MLTVTAECDSVDGARLDLDEDEEDEEAKWTRRSLLELEDDVDVVEVLEHCGHHEWKGARQ